jgi:hypothetical protein
MAAKLATRPQHLRATFALTCLHSCILHSWALTLDAVGRLPKAGMSERAYKIGKSWRAAWVCRLLPASPGWALVVGAVAPVMALPLMTILARLLSARESVWPPCRPHACQIAQAYGWREGGISPGQAVIS